MNTSMNVHKSINFTVLTYFPAKASLDIMYVCIDDNKNHLKEKKPPKIMAYIDLLKVCKLSIKQIKKILCDEC